MKQSLQLRIGQSLTMTPQLQQAIKLLQLSSLELQTEIQQTLDSNPMLEQEDNFGEVTVLDFDKLRDSEDATNFTVDEGQFTENRAEQELPDELAIDTSWENIYEGQGGSYGEPSSASADNRDLFENQSATEDSLKIHLVWQLDCSHLSETDHEIGLANEKWPKRCLRPERRIIAFSKKRVIC